MNNKDFQELITPLAEWTVDSDNVNLLMGKTSKDGEIKHTPPEKGHTVVLAFKSKQISCDWCGDQVNQPNIKVWSRSIGSNIWTGKCKDCKQKRVSNQGITNE
jgi:ribosomal protein S27E